MKWALLFVGFYPYAIYPCIAWILGRMIRKAVPDQPYVPSVTVVISAYNEESCIAATVKNKLAQDYPADKLGVTVVSDASSDRTDAIVKEIAAVEPRVRLIRQPERSGKTAALNLALANTSSDLVVFSDANSIYDEAAIRKLAICFAVSEIGYATGRMQYVGHSQTVAGGGSEKFIEFENWLRRAETRIGSVVGVDGDDVGVEVQLGADAPAQAGDLLFELAQQARVLAGDGAKRVGGDPQRLGVGGEEEAGAGDPRPGIAPPPRPRHPGA